MLKTDPEKMDSNANNIITSANLKQAIDRVLKLETLLPCEKTNAAFTTLVNLIIHYKGIVKLQKDLVRQMQQVAGLAECELEKFWARLVINSEKPKSTFKQFPYYSNYQKLVKRELQLLHKTGLDIFTSEMKVLFIGSGPLNMSSVFIGEYTDAYVDNVDVCKTAIELSENLAEALGLTCGFIIGDGATVSPNNCYDLVVIAALAGITQSEKQLIIDNVRPKLNEGGRILIRSAIGSRELLYPKLNVNELMGVKVLVEYHPTDDVINSVIICSLI